MSFNRIIITIFICMCAYQAYGDEFIFPFPASIGEACSAYMPEGYVSVHYNPALLAAADVNTVIFSQSRIYYDTYAYEAGFNGIIGDKEKTNGIFTGFSAGFSQKIKQDAPVTQILYNMDGTPRIDSITGELKTETLYFSDSIDSVLILGIGFSMSDFFYSGFSISGIRKQHGSEGAWGGALNFGVALKPIKALVFGVYVKNIGRTGYFWSDLRQDYDPMYAAAGISLDFPLKINLMLDMGYKHENGGSIHLKAGLEAEILEGLNLRAGYSREGFAAGCGFKTENIIINYAFVPGDNFYDSNRFSAMYKFE